MYRNGRLKQGQISWRMLTNKICHVADIGQTGDCVAIHGGNP